MEKTAAKIISTSVLTNRSEETPAVERLVRLQRLALALVHATTAEQTADAILSEGLSAFNPVAGSVCLLNADGTHLEAVRTFGQSPETSGQNACFSLETSMPLTEAVRRGESIFLDSPTQGDGRYPTSLRDAERERGTLAVVLLKVQERILGAIEITFANLGSLCAEERAFLETTAQIGASAFERIRRHDAERRAEEAHARNFFDDLTDGLIAYNGEWRVMFANEIAAASARLPREALGGKVIWEVFPEFVGSDYHTACLKVMNERVPVRREDYWPRYDVWFENQILPIKDGVAVLFRDVTERKRAEEALRAAEAQLRLVTDTAPMLICYIDRQERFRFVNRAYADWFGVPTEQIVGKSVRKVIPPEAYEAIGEHFRTALSGQTVSYERAVADKTGQERHISAVYVPDIGAEGEVRGFVGVVTDITTRKQAEALQQTFNDLFLHLANLTDPEAIQEWTVTTVGKALDVGGCTMVEVDVEQNQAKILRGYAPGLPVIAGTYALSDLIAPEGIALYRQGKTCIVPDIADIDTTAGRKTHYHPMYIGAYLTVPFLRGGRWVGILGVYTSRPRQWKPEEIAFVEAVGERAWLSLDNARLFQAERERSEQLALAISEVHHRVKNNLQAVGALLEIQIPLEGDSVPVEAVQDSLSQIKTIALVHDLLTRDKPIGHVDVAQVLSNLAKLLSEGMRVGEQALPITVQTEPAPMSTKAATALALAVNELLTNAAKHHVRSDADSSEPPAAIEVSLSRRGEEVVVVVRDYGPGFPPGFDALRQAHIGLEVVQTLVSHDLQGRITFGNVVGEDAVRVEGAKVEIVFPANLPDD